jgi:isopentenyl phosphate kinase
MIVRLIKLGGTTITRDGCDGLFDADNVRRMAVEIFSQKQNCIIVHGTGLVGKRPAVEHDYVATGIIGADKPGLSADIRRSLLALNSRVVAVLLESGLHVIPMSTPQYFTSSGDALRSGKLAEGLRRAARQGAVPVFYGDILPQPDGSYRVMSSDAIMAILSAALRPEVASYMFTGADGVCSRSPVHPEQKGDVIPVLTASNLSLMYRSPDDGRDVSGGMGGKVEQALRIAAYAGSCTIANGRAPGVIGRVLSGQDVLCTRVIAGRELEEVPCG